MPNFSEEAREYEIEYEDDWEGEAHAQRGDFLQKFPLETIASLTLENYAIGLKKYEGFCYWVEQGTRKWAKIVGATADKFGIYYGKTKTDSTVRYRYTKKFSDGLAQEGADREAFRRVRDALVHLLSAGQKRDFLAIDLNPLSQMLKAKILSLYVPELYLPICSADNLRDLAPVFDLDDASPSEIQHCVLTAKASSAGVRDWSALKYMAFLYEKVLRNGPTSPRRRAPSARLKKKAAEHPNVDFAKLQALWEKLGKQSEAFAFAQEQARLTSMNQSNLAKRIKDRRSQPRYGYDFESFSGTGHPRYIEVKTFTPVDGENARFFLSQNELLVANDPKFRDHYYFYLVVYDNGEPIECQMRSAKHVLGQCEMQAQSYLVRLGKNHEVS